jgi:glycerol-3-phosphate dehydrogenase
MITRDPGKAQHDRFDLIVVGGGIYGSMVALEAARRGLRPLLLERDDFGQHTSASWLHILHGGLRYLQRLDMARHRESVTEQRWWLETFPDLVAPLRCLMPLDGRGLRRPSAMRAALAADRILGRWWDPSPSTGPALPESRILTVTETRKLIPYLRGHDLVGGAVWYDAFAVRPQRLLLETLRWAAALGATLLNRVEVEGIEVRAGHVTGVTARDGCDDRALSFAAPAVVVCCGPWGPDLTQTIGAATPTPLFQRSVALNVLLEDRAEFEGALAVRAPRRGARTYFLRSWNGRLFAGTYHAADPHGEIRTRPDPERVDAFLAELGEAVPGLDPVASRVLRVLRGYLPVTSPGTVRLAARSTIADHERTGGPIGLFSVAGVKYTVARKVAEGIVDRVLGPRVSVRRPDPEIARPAPAFVPTLGEMDDLVSRDPRAARRVISDLAKSESAMCVEDVLFRRTDWGTFLDPGSPTEGVVRDVLGPRHR